MKVKLVNAGTGADQYTKLQNTIKAGSGAPDVAQVEYYALPQFALSESLLDLSSYGFDSLEKDKFATSTWSSVSIDGKVYGLPQDSGPMALFYNKKVFDKHGIAVPKTWDEYVTAAKKLHQADPNAYIAADSGDAGFTTSMIAQAGGTPFTTDGDKVTINLQDEGTEEVDRAPGTSSSRRACCRRPSAGPTTGTSSSATARSPRSSPAPGCPATSSPSVADAKGDWRVAPMPTYDG